MRGSLKATAIVAGLVLMGLCSGNGLAQNPSDCPPTPCPPIPEGKTDKECGMYVWIPPTYRTCTERVCVKPASETCEQIPAVYESRNRRVCVKPASERCETIPAEY